jgi:F420-dependent oxidoreductase-like protein
MRQRSPFVTLKFGCFVPQGWRRDLIEIADPVEKFEAMTAVAKAADAGPWDSIWLYDHFHTVPEPTMEATFECWTTSATLARDTRRIKIGQMVSCTGYRNPALLAKIASTIDVASHGRLNCGIGAGWYEQEWRAYGYDYPETRELMGMFRESVEILHRMWTEDGPEFRGKYYRIDKPINEPKGVQSPRIPLWIGGGGEQVTLKLVARFGDACNIGSGHPENIPHKLEVLKRHCDNVGRDYNEIIKSSNLMIHSIPTGADPERATERMRRATGESFEEYVKSDMLVGTTEAVIERIGQLVDAGIDYVIVYLPLVAYDHEPMQRFVEDVMPAFASMNG